MYVRTYVRTYMHMRTWLLFLSVCCMQGISYLQHLRVLDLSENRLMELPETIGDLQHLTDLYVADNCLTFLPETLGTYVHMYVRMYVYT